MTLQRRLVSLAATMCLALGSVSDVVAQGNDEYPEWMQEAMARETRSMGKRKFKALDGSFESSLRALKIKTKEDYDWGTYLVLDIGADADAGCYLYSDSLSITELLKALAQSTLDETLKANNATLGTKTITQLDFDHAEGHPFYIIEHLYTADQNDQTIAVQTRAASAYIDGFYVGCTHSELGYTKTFKKMFVSLVENAEVVTATENARLYRELQVLRIDRQPIGYAMTTIERDAEGDILTASDVVTIAAVDADTLATSETYSSEWTHPDGQLINAFETSAENGNLMMDLTLNLNDDAQWLVAGEVQQKDFETVLDPEATLASTLDALDAIRQLTRDDGLQTVTLSTWSPDLDPSTVSEFRIEEVAGVAGTPTAMISIGPLRLRTEFDEDGMATEQKMRLGGSEIVSERVWFEGKAPELE